MNILKILHYVCHFLWLFMSCFALSVLAESVFSQYKVDFVNQCVILKNCCVS
jgi:hypothetical protein